MAHTAQQRKFATAAKAARNVCIVTAAKASASRRNGVYKSCLSREMKRRLRGGSKSRRRRRRGFPGLQPGQKVCVKRTGPNKGKLKKGWRFGRGGRCVKVG